MGDDYARLCRALGDEQLPAAVVDLDAMEANADRIAAEARIRGKTLRIATKSVRSPELLRLIAARTGARGFMTYSAAETLFLAEQGFSDLLLAYPTAHPRDAEMLAKAGAAVTVDCVEHVEVLERAAISRMPVIIDLDVSKRAFGQHLGVRRSPLRTADAVVALARRIADSPKLEFRGVLAYEAQIAGLPDFAPGRPLRSLALRVLKSRSRREVIL